MPGQQAQVEGRDSLGRNQPVGISDPVAASQALTLSGNAVAGETFTVGQTYTWVTTLTLGTPNQVKVGVDAATSIVNGTAAINGGGGGDTLFTAATPVNKFVTAVATSSTVLTVTAKETGAGPNAIPTTETMSVAAWGAATLAGGTYGALKTSGAGGGSSPAGAPVTVTSAIVPQSTTATIPIGAKGWTFTVLTGTATFNGAAALPAGFSDSDVNTLAAAISYTTASASTAYVRYNS